MGHRNAAVVAAHRHDFRLATHRRGERAGSRISDSGQARRLSSTLTRQLRGIDDETRTGIRDGDGPYSTAALGLRAAVICGVCAHPRQLTQCSVTWDTGGRLRRRTLAGGYCITLGIFTHIEDRLHASTTRSRTSAGGRLDPGTGTRLGVARHSRRRPGGGRALAVVYHRATLISTLVSDRLTPTTTSDGAVSRAGGPNPREALHLDGDVDRYGQCRHTRVVCVGHRHRVRRQRMSRQGRASAGDPAPRQQGQTRPTERWRDGRAVLTTASTCDIWGGDPDRGGVGCDPVRVVFIARAAQHHRPTVACAGAVDYHGRTPICTTELVDHVSSSHRVIIVIHGAGGWATRWIHLAALEVDGWKRGALEADVERDRTVLVADPEKVRRIVAGHRHRHRCV
jgi:hypothetical protein